jgi:phospholipid/cholesterol/gamma-HCH transport system ATP-binding protein
MTQLILDAYEMIPPPPVVELRSVSRSFGGQQVLRDVDLAIPRGETVAIIGESGCGKSVTLKLMLRLLRPTVGEVHWDGQPIHNLSERRLALERLRFGFLFQMAALFDSLTVYENVAFGLRQNTSLDEDRVAQIVDERMRDVGLSPAQVAGKKPAELSGGMRKRVGLARALALDPEVILYDEPTTGLDPIMSDVINELILQTRRSRPVTSIVVTHDMHTVRRVPDRVVMLSPLGRLRSGEPQVIFDGRPQEAFESQDPRLREFIRGEAGARLREMSAA